MTIDEYQKAAQRTSNGVPHNKLLNGCLGLAGECGEVCDIVKKHLYQGHELDVDHLIEEAGDIAWYLTELAAGLNVSLDVIFQRNIDKLWKRFPTGFDSERSRNREV